MKARHRMLQSVFIQNFKAWEDQTFSLNGEHVAFVGENESGKSSILQALDCFFNRDAIDPADIRDAGREVCIGVRYNGTTFKKTFDGRTGRVVSRHPAALWGEIARVHYLHLPAASKPSTVVLRELAQAKLDELLPPQLERELEERAQEALAAVLPWSAGSSETPAAEQQVSAVAQLAPGAALDIALQRGGSPIDELPLTYRDKLTCSLLANSSYPNLVLGVDDVERAFPSLDPAAAAKLAGAHVAQLLATTRSQPVLQQGGLAVTVPVGSRPGGNVAHILQALDGSDRAFLLVEGKYDLPWYKTAAKLAGYGDTLNVLPAGGTNLDELRREMANLGMRCIAIVDGDTKPDERVGKYALRRECVELYTPNGLLRDLFGSVPPKTGKREFFASIQASQQASENGIKAAISERISQHLGPSSLFVSEVAAILQQAAHR